MDRGGIDEVAAAVMLRELRGREVGATRPSSLATHVRANRTRHIELASHKEIVSAHKSGINSLQVRHQHVVLNFFFPAICIHMVNYGALVFLRGFGSQSL